MDPLQRNYAVLEQIQGAGTERVSGTVFPTTGSAPAAIRFAPDHVGHRGPAVPLRLAPDGRQILEIKLVFADPIP